MVGAYGVAHDTTLAYVHLERAARCGSVDALRALADLARRAKDGAERGALLDARARVQEEADGGAKR